MKNMKKWMRMMAMALMAVAMTVGFAACSSDDDEKKEPDPSTILDYVFLNITYSENQDMKTLGSLLIDYSGFTDFVGNDDPDLDTDKATVGKDCYYQLRTTNSNYLRANQISAFLKKTENFKKSYTIDFKIKYEFFRMMKDKSYKPIDTDLFPKDGYHFHKTITAQDGVALTKEEIIEVLNTIKEEVKENFQKNIWVEIKDGNATIQEANFPLN